MFAYLKNLHEFINKNHIIVNFLIISYGIYQAAHYAWTCDDAYISFVYSRNLWEGNGLVFNLGEKVEGYTNFLWTILLSLSYPLHIRIENFANGLSILFYALTILSMRNLFVKITYALFLHGAIFATSGLETSLFTFLLTLTYLFYKENHWNAMLSISALSILVRPDGIIFFVGSVILSIESFLRNNNSLDSLFKEQTKILNQDNMDDPSSYVLPIFQLSTWRKYFQTSWLGWTITILFGFVYLGKVFYYGELLPNTFYAKVDSDEYFKQGIVYFILFYKEYIVFSLFLIVGIIFSKSKFSWLLISYLFYVLYVGGDFMFGRFIVPIIPIAIQLTWILLGESQNTWQNKFPNLGRVISYIIFLLFILSPSYRSENIIRNATKIWEETGIAEERNFYKNLGSTKLEYDLDSLKNFRVAFYGAQAHFIYYLRPAYALESATGLTDYQLARQTLNVRGKIGHEKLASLNFLKEKNIEIVMTNIYHELDSSSNLTYSWNGIDLNWKLIQENIYDKNGNSSSMDELLKNDKFTLKSPPGL